MNNPQMILQMMLKNSNIKNNSMLQNAMNMMNAGDTKGIQTLVENYCRTNNIDLEMVKRQIEQKFR